MMFPRNPWLNPGYDVSFAAHGAPGGIDDMAKSVEIAFRMSHRRRHEPACLRRQARRVAMTQRLVAPGAVDKAIGSLLAPIEAALRAVNGKDD